MDLSTLLRDRAEVVVNEALAELCQARLAHYEADGYGTARQRLSDLLDLTLRCIEEGRADPIVDYATRVGGERFAAGYDLCEVQIAINVLEEVLWKRILSSVGPEELAHALGLVNAILGMAKDTLARTYVSLATEQQPSPVDMRGFLRWAQSG